MKTGIKILILGLILSNHIQAQNIDTSLIGTYSDGLGGLTITELQLRKDGSFKLRTPDPVFSYTYRIYENSGKWIADGNRVVLNPEFDKRPVRIAINEKQTDKADSITLKINYQVRYFEGNALTRQEQFNFQLLTIYINEKKRYYNLVRRPVMRICLFAPRVRRQIIVDSTNTFKIPLQEMSKIGIFTYGFDEIKWLNISNIRSNFININITQPIDKERSPRQKEVIIKGKKAYFYTLNGKVDKSLTPLKKQNN